MLAALWVCQTALAWPVDWNHEVEAGRQKAIKLPRVDWFEVDEPSILKVVWMEEARELLLIGLKPGRATVLLGAEGRVAAWRVRVDLPPLLGDRAQAMARKACPDFTATPQEEVKLAVTVGDEDCRTALVELFQTDAFEARHLSLRFESKVLQAQLRLVQEGVLKATGGKVKARYVGAGLVLDGQASVAEHRKMLWEILRRTIGRFALDDQIKMVEPDGGL